MENSGAFKLRPARPDDAAGIVAAHRSAILGTARAAYPGQVLEGWAGSLPEERAADLANEIRRGGSQSIVVVESDAGAIAGFGSLVADSSEIRAVYVDSRFSRRGVGAMIMAGLEKIAREHNLHALHLEASLNAERFYLTHGFKVERHVDVRLHNGTVMAALLMFKTLD